MKIAVFGATGFIGTRLAKAIKDKGWYLLPLDIRRDPAWRESLKQVDAVINLAGHPIFGERWNPRVKALIYDSRVEGTRKIAQALTGTRVKVLVNASAIGYYGDGEEDKDEESPPAHGFLSRVCVEWENAARSAERLAGIRTVIVRLGVVLGHEGGALKQMLLPFRLGVGGPIGLTGSQSMSWVHVDDAVGIFLHALENENCPPVLNATSPNIVSNKEFSRTLGRALHRPAFLPLPKCALYLMVGEAAGVIASGQRIHPKATLQSGYKFKYPKLEAALTKGAKSV